MIYNLNVTFAEQLGSEESDLCTAPKLSRGMLLLDAFIAAVHDKG